MDRPELYGILDSFLAALKARDASRLPWASAVRHSENNVMLVPGDGVWATNTGLGEYDLRFADPVTGQVGWFGTVIEPLEESAFCLRIGVDPAGQIAEVELVIVRDSEYGMALPGKRFWSSRSSRRTRSPPQRVRPCTNWPTAIFQRCNSTTGRSTPGSSPIATGSKTACRPPTTPS